MNYNYTIAHDDTIFGSEAEEIFLRVDENSPFMTPANGLNDRTNLLKHLICFAAKNNCTLIAPKFNLELQHQYPLEGGDWSGKSRKSNLSEYYNFNEIRLNNKLIRVELNKKQPNKEIITFWSNQNSLPIPKLLINAMKEYATVGGFYIRDPSMTYPENICIPHIDSIQNIADSIRKQLPEKFICLHWRRGDKLADGNRDGMWDPERYGNILSPKNIIKTIEKLNTYGIYNIYIMTDALKDSDPAINELTKFKDYNFYFNFDFPQLMEIKKEDNYKVFCIEKEIVKFAVDRIRWWQLKENYE